MDQFVEMTTDVAAFVWTCIMIYVNDNMYTIVTTNPATMGHIWNDYNTVEQTSMPPYHRTVRQTRYLFE